MSAAVYHEPYRLRAGIFAVAVHGAFFALLYFGFSWRTEPAATMTVELWQGMPGTSAAAPVKPKVDEVTPPEPKKTVKPDIVLPDKKKVEVKPLPKPVVAKHAEAKPAEAKPDTGTGDQRLAREQGEGAAAAATGQVVDEYKARIAAKIRSYIVMPPGVPDDARAEFSVTVLPGGSVLPPQLRKSSGNAAYDSAVERAIIKAQPLPLPPDVGLFNRFREMQLGFRPKEKD